MVRAAAKNHAERRGDHRARAVPGRCWPRSRPADSRWRSAAGWPPGRSPHTAAYDAAVASWFASAYAPDELAAETGWPDVIGARLDPPGRAPLRREPAPAAPRSTCAARRGAATARASPAPSSCTARRCPTTTTSTPTRPAARPSTSPQPCVAIIKHSNPCGIAVGADLADGAPQGARLRPGVRLRRRDRGQRRGHRGARRRRSRTSSPRSIIAPGLRARALDILTGKKNLRLLRCPAAAARRASSGGRISGGLLMQTADQVAEPGDDPASWQLAAGDPASAEALADLAFAWQACRAVKSNAILLASGGASVGIGMGQVNRVDSARLAVTRAGERAARVRGGQRRVLPVPRRASRCWPRRACARSSSPAGRSATSSSSSAAQAAGVTLYFTGVRHFYH